MKLRLLVFISLLFFIPSLASAQGFSARNLEFTFSEGASFFSSKNFQIGAPQSSIPIDGAMTFDTVNRHEARLSFFTTNRFGLEGFYGYQKAPVVFSQDAAPDDKLSIPLQIHSFGGTFLYYVAGTPESKWRPFISVSGGATLFRPTGSGQDIATDPLRGNLSAFIESSRASASIGAGLKRSLSNSFGLRFDIANFFASAPTFGLPQTSDLPNASVLPVSGRINNMQASVGIILYLGK